MIIDAIARYPDSAPVLPGLALDVAFHSPVLTATASGRDLVAVVLRHAFQVAAVITLNTAGEIADMRIYSRPWPVTALFRGEVYKLLRGSLGPEFWQGPAPLAVLGEQLPQ